MSRYNIFFFFSAFLLFGCGVRPITQTQATKQVQTPKNILSYLALDSKTLTSVVGKSFYIVSANYTCTPYLPITSSIASYADKITVNNGGAIHFGDKCNDALATIDLSELKISNDYKFLQYKGTLYTYSAVDPTSPFKESL